MFCSNAQWQWEKRAPFCCWLTFPGEPFPKKGKGGTAGQPSLVAKAKHLPSGCLKVRPWDLSCGRLFLTGDVRTAPSNERTTNKTPAPPNPGFLFWVGFVYLYSTSKKMTNDKHTNVDIPKPGRLTLFSDAVFPSRVSEGHGQRKSSRTQFKE